MSKINDLNWHQPVLNQLFHCLHEGSKGFLLNLWCSEKLRPWFTIATLGPSVIFGLHLFCWAIISLLAHIFFLKQIEGQIVTAVSWTVGDIHGTQKPDWNGILLPCYHCHSAPFDEYSRPRMLCSGVRKSMLSHWCLTSSTSQYRKRVKNVLGWLLQQIGATMSSTRKGKGLCLLW